MNFVLFDVSEVPAPGDEDHAPTLEDARARLETVARLWRLLDEPERADRIMEIVDHPPAADEDGHVFLDLFEIDELIKLIGDVVERTEASLTTHWHLRPEVSAHVLAREPRLVVQAELADKRKVPSLTRPLANAMEIQAYLLRAFTAGSRILID